MTCRMAVALTFGPCHNYSIHNPAPTQWFNLLACRLLREGRLGDLAVCIIDELHMIRDPDRGPALETSITKLLFSPSGRQVQVLFAKP